VHGFPGFLGQPENLEYLRAHLASLHGIPLEWRITIADPHHNDTWKSWAERWLSENPPAPVTADGPVHEVVLGYSLGGRAAAHLAIAAPERFQGLIALSSHPGLAEAAEREARVAADEAWALRFETENWDDLLTAWNAQAVFRSTDLPSRLRDRETQGSRDVRDRCARQLRQFSLGRQTDLAPGLLRLGIPQAWITGESDLKFTEITRRLSGSSLIHREVVAKAGHRWPWELEETDAALVIARALDFLLKQDSR
jgi:pimeloyl-ACP methyl ester carboxylesterase